MNIVRIGIERGEFRETIGVKKIRDVIPQTFFQILLIFRLRIILTRHPKPFQLDSRMVIIHRPELQIWRGPIEP